MYRFDDAVSRVEFGRFDGTKVVETPQGGLKVPAYPTRTGVLLYSNPDGTTRREYRPPEEVFAQDSLASLEDAPITLGHPGMVTAANHASLAKGHVRDIKQDGSLVAATALVQDADVVDGVRSGSLKELSCGYTCKFDATPGTAPDGSRYDGVQRHIRYNHVALLPPGAGRAGSQVSLRLDSATAVQVREDEVEPPAEPAQDPAPVETQAPVFTQPRPWCPPQLAMSVSMVGGLTSVVHAADKHISVVNFGTHGASLSRPVQAEVNQDSAASTARSAAAASIPEPKAHPFGNAQPRHWEPQPLAAARGRTRTVQGRRVAFNPEGGATVETFTRTEENPFE